MIKYFLKLLCNESKVHTVFLPRLDVGLVDNGWSLAFAIKRAVGRHSAIALLFQLLLLQCQGSVVVEGNVRGYIFCTGVAQFDCMSVEIFVPS